MKTNIGKISIIIPTKNAGILFKNVLEGIFSQTYKNFEVIIIDSGSTDKTLKIASEFPVKIIEIKPHEFGHGKTRNYGAKIAKGNHIVYLTHDAIPYNENWLINLIKPFKNPKIVGVFGRQIPKKNDHITDKLFYYSLYPNKNKIWKSNAIEQGDNIFSSVNSAIRKEILTKFPFPQDIIVSEDYKWASTVLNMGLSIFYSREAAVIHSNSYNDLYYLFRRNFDIGISYKYIYSKGQTIKFLIKGILITFQQIKELIKIKKYIYIPLILLKDLIRFIGINLGKREHIFSKSIKKNILSDQRWYWV